LYQVSSKSPKGFRRNCESNAFFKEMLLVQGLQLLEIIIRQGSPSAYLHNVIFLCTKFHQFPKMFRDSGVAKKRVFSKKMIISGAVTP
jgi:hypothetical protein